jgi:ferredoxin
MDLNEIHKSLEKIGSVSIMTLDGNTMHSRIISIFGGDEEGIYFFNHECGSCYRVCPQDAMELSSTIYIEINYEKLIFYLTLLTL